MSNTALLTTEAPALPDLPADPMALEPSLEPVEQLVDPQLLIAAAAAVRDAAPGPVLVEQVTHAVLGLWISSIQSPRVAIALARMVRADGAPQS